MNLHLFTNTLARTGYGGSITPKIDNIDTAAPITIVPPPLTTSPETQIFDGATFDKDRDGKRLTAQIYRVYAAIKDGQWHTLSELAKICGDPEASVSARLRDMRKPRYNSMQIERRYVRRGLHEYRLTLDKIVE